MRTIYFILTLAVLLVGLGAWEVVRHRMNLRRIPVRIHVNGTRGKSSVTRLIAAGLREGGVVACAKTTGTLPRFIMPDGREVPVYRPSRANVIEQSRIVAAAASFDARVLVIECMAIQPELQWLCENKFVRATHAVITNARPDHLDAMGPTEEDVAWALAGMIPKGAKLYTAERRHLPILAAAALDRGAELVVVGEAEEAAITDEEMRRFPYWEHAENVALALRVCADMGVERSTALAGMFKASPDPGAMTEHEINFFGKKVYFVNGFAANDPESTERIWRMALEKYTQAKMRVAVFNCRADRPDRSLQLGAAYAAWPQADHVVLMGEGTYIFARAAVNAGAPSEKIIFAEDRRTEEIFETLIGLISSSGLVMGMGNIGGQGLDLAAYFRNRENPRENA